MKKQENRKKGAVPDRYSPQTVSVFCSNHLHYALSQHGVRHLDEARDVGAHHIVFGVAIGLGGRIGVCENVLHDPLELCIDLFKAPGEALAVLAHLQGGGCHTAGVGRFAGGKEHACLLQHLGGLDGGGHIGAFRPGSAMSQGMLHTPRPW